MPRRSAILRPYSVWCSTDPSVIRGPKFTDLLYHGEKKASRKQINNNYGVSLPFHVKLDKSRRNGIETYKKRGGSDNRPNIFKISQPEKNVNRNIVINNIFFALFKRKLFDLDNIPSCFFRKQWYDKYTKR